MCPHTALYLLYTAIYYILLYTAIYLRRRAATSLAYAAPLLTHCGMQKGKKIKKVASSAVQHTALFYIMLAYASPLLTHCGMKKEKKRLKR